MKNNISALSNLQKTAAGGGSVSVILIMLFALYGQNADAITSLNEHKIGTHPITDIKYDYILDELKSINLKLTSLDEGVDHLEKINCKEHKDCK